VTSAAPLLVFAQPADVRVDIDAWCAHASRFFATRIGLANEPNTFVIAPDGRPPGIRSAIPRPCTADDLSQAAAADAGGGLAELAQRCKTIWQVPRESRSDSLALTLAMILASLHLGPILDRTTPELFGLKTARAKLTALLAPLHS